MRLGVNSLSRYLFDNLEDLKIFKNDPKTAIVTDIDGTISEIAPTPEKHWSQKPCKICWLN